MLVAVSEVPFWVLLAFHMFVTTWLPPQVQVTFQVEDVAVPVLITVMFAVNPAPQSLVFWNTALHEWVPPPPLGLTVQVKEALPEALVVSRAVTVTLLVPAVVGVPEM